MSDSTLVIKKYFHGKRSRELANVFAQVDHVCSLAVAVLKADFVGVFYRKRGHDVLVPLAYRNETDRDIASFRLLEERWARRRDSNSAVERIFIDHVGDTSDSSSPKDLFASEYGFTHSFQYPHYAGNQLRGVLIAYWLHHHEPTNADTDRILACLFQILDGTMLSAEAIQTQSNYSIRLSELIAMFEIPVGDYRFNELLSKLVAYAQKVFPKAGFALFSPDSGTGGFTVNEYYDRAPPRKKFVDSVTRRMGLLCDDAAKRESLRSRWTDLTEACEGGYTAVAASVICLDAKVKIVLVAWTQQPAGFSRNDRELLSAFSLFAQTILRDALQMRSLAKANRLLKKSTKQLADLETVAALADMTAGIAHDFNNVMGGVVGRVQLMKVKVRDESILFDLDKIEAQVMDGAETVRRIQEFTTGAKYKKLKPTDLSKIVRGHVDKREAKWRELAKSRNVSVVSRCLVDEAVIQGHKADLHTALEKLIENAVEHSYEGSTVEVALTEEGKYFQVSVSNKGPQIASDIRGKVFYPFFTTKREHGSGLGLAVVRGIVVRHGGKVEFTSAESGTVFNVRLIRPDRLDEDTDVTDTKKRNRRLKVLVVDDDEQIRGVLNDMLTIDGHETTACADGYSALEAFEENEFDLLITDLGMPGMSGLDLAGVVHERKPELPIAMITGWGTQLNSDEMAMKGIGSVLAKPFHLKDIEALVHELVPD